MSETSNCTREMGTYGGRWSRSIGRWSRCIVACIGLNIIIQSVWCPVVWCSVFPDGRCLASWFYLLSITWLFFNIPLFGVSSHPMRLPPAVSPPPMCLQWSGQSVTLWLVNNVSSSRISSSLGTSAATSRLRCGGPTLLTKNLLDWVHNSMCLMFGRINDSVWLTFTVNKYVDYCGADQRPQVCVPLTFHHVRFVFQTRHLHC